MRPPVLRQCRKEVEYLREMKSPSQAEDTMGLSPQGAGEGVSDVARRYLAGEGQGYDGGDGSKIPDFSVLLAWQLKHTR